MQARGRLVTAEIDLQAYEKNVRSVQSLLSPHTKLMAVVKGNAYGHGIVPIAVKAQSLGVNYFGVVCLFEGRQLRSAGISTPILLLNYTAPEDVSDAIALDLTINVMDDEVLRAVSFQAGKQKKRAKVHVKIDSGMHRLGVMPQHAVAFIRNVSRTKNVQLEGIFTHFAEADSDGEDMSFTKKQLATFQEILDTLTGQGVTPPLIHAANSAATLRLPKSHFTMVRPGMVLYAPLPHGRYALPFASKQILSLKTQVAQIRRIQEGESVGYGRAFIAKKAMMIAALPIGYADGFRRSPNFGEVLVRGQRVPIIGRVSMDQSSVDVSRVKNVKIGDEVMIVGKQGSEEITTQEIADRIGTINYEVLTSLGERISRIYRDKKL